MAKKLAFLAILIIVLAAAYGAAAALNVTADPLQAGGDDTLVCDEDYVQVEWITNLYGDGKFHIDAVRLVQIDEGCLDKGAWALVALFENVGPGGATMATPGMFHGAITSGSIELTECWIPGENWTSCAGRGPAVEDVTSVQVLIKNTAE